MVELAQTGLEEEHWLADQNCQNWSAWLGLNGSSPLDFFLNSLKSNSGLSKRFQTVFNEKAFQIY